jgi:tyrosyl-tRNA synthetase
MDIDEKAALVASIGEEVISIDELKELLERKKHPVAYNGFEPSGRMHIAQSLGFAINVGKLLKAGCKVKILVADWHAQANGKLDGDMEKIQTAGKYFIEVWKGCGLDTDNVEFVWASELVKDTDYWQTVLKIGTINSVDRIKRCSQIMGRDDEEGLNAAQILYPLMQCADIFHLGVDICQLGMDQRKVNMLAREVAPKLGKEKPIVVSHHMLLGLLEPPKNVTDAVARAAAMKMSKSKPDSAVFSDDPAEEVARKLKNAYCPAKQAEENPILEYCKHIIFERMDSLTISRPEKYGGPLVFSSYDALESAFVAGDIHPMDLKSAVATALNELLEPVRHHFSTHKRARELAEEVATFRVTR